MVIDACMAKLFNKKFDRNGAVAKRGNVLRNVIDSLLREHYFLARPPKSCGREEYGETFVDVYLTMLRHEIELFARHVTDWEGDRYREVM